MFLKKLKKYFFKKLIDIFAHHIWDEEVAELNVNLAKIVAPGLRRFSKISSNSHPSHLTKEEWEYMLNSMTDAFEWFSKEENQAKIEEHHAHMSGIELFAKNYTFLRYDNE